MIKFSANLGFLWKDLPLPDAIRSAKAAGFDAVECHAPFEYPTSDVNSALAETGLPMLGINTRRGDSRKGDIGLAAIPGREAEAQEAIAEALRYAHAINANSVHVMAGIATGQRAHDAFRANLEYAVGLAKVHGTTVLIEPLNRHDAPGYFLSNTDQARRIIEDLAAPNLKLLFDCYHVGRTEGDVIARLTSLMPIIGHIQFASVPDRGPPDRGEVNYAAVFAEVLRLRWERPLGAEYTPPGNMDASLSWMSELQPPA